MLEAALSSLILIGAAFVFVGSLGLVRLKDFYTRLHGPTKATTLGVGSLLIASVLFFSTQGNGLSLHEILVTLFLFITAPVSAHLLAKAALHLRVRSVTPVPELVTNADGGGDIGGDTGRDAGAVAGAAPDPLPPDPLPTVPSPPPLPVTQAILPAATGTATLGGPAVEPGPTGGPTGAVTAEPQGIGPDPVYLALCTCPDSASAERLAASLVDDGLAACVNIVPGLVSIYRWQGERARDAEVLLLIKTTAARLHALTDHVARHHSYETPEVIALPVTAGLDAYLDWVRASTRPPTAG